MRGVEYAELAAFVAVARERNFRRAAARLGMSPSALSHSIRKLEERIGARLLNRTTRSVAPSDAGTMLLRQLVPAFSDIESAVEKVNAFRDQVAGTVRLNLPKLAGYSILEPMLGRFAKAYPEVRLELEVDDALTDIIAGGFDAGIRPGNRVHKDMIAVRVTPALDVAVVGSPTYLAAHGRPDTPHELTQHACINYRWSRDGTLYRWKFAHDGNPLEVVPEGPVTTNDTDVMVMSAVQGLGLAYTLKSRVSGHLARGELEQVLSDWSEPVPGFFLYFPGRRQLSPALRALIDFLKVETPRPA